MEEHTAEDQDITLVKLDQKRHKADAEAQHPEEEAKKEEEEGEGKEEEEDEQTDDANDRDDSGLQLGNVDLAIASRELLSDAMLAGLHTAIQDRLKEYASSHVWSSPHVTTGGQTSR